jgi:hypothetical protein
MLCVFGANAQFSGGTGDYWDPYIIANKQDLKTLSENPTYWGFNTFMQTADIVFTAADFQEGGDFFNGGQGFIPIGNADTKFTSTYYGEGHIIENLYINREGDWTIGLFGFCQNGYIDNLGLINVDITGGNVVGAIAGRNECTIASCFATGFVVASDDRAGGLVGHNNGTIGKVYYSWANVETSAYQRAGGLVGLNSAGAEIINCYSRGGVAATVSPGGLVAENGALVENSFWSIDDSNQNESDGGTGVGFWQLQDITTFTNAGWLVGSANSGNNWKMNCTFNEGYPYNHWYGIPHNISAGPAPNAPSNQELCEGAPVSNLEIDADTALYYITLPEDGFTQLQPDDALPMSTQVYMSTIVDGCESNYNIISVTLNENNVVSPTGATEQEICSTGSIADIEVAGDNVIWYDAETDGNELALDTPIEETTYYATQTVGGCESLTPLAVSVTELNIAAPTGDLAQAFCEGSTVGDLAATGEDITWYGNVMNSPALDPSEELVTATYNASQTIDGCESSDLLSVSVTVNAFPDATITQDLPTLTSNAADADYQWVDCNDNFAAIDGETNASFTPEASGSYAVTATANGCSSTSDCVEVTITNIQDAGDLSQARFYPNPAEDEINIEAGEDFNFVELLDLSGKQVMRSTERKLSVAELPAGVYLVKIYLHKGVTTQRMLKH